MNSTRDGRHGAAIRLDDAVLELLGGVGDLLRIVEVRYDFIRRLKFIIMIKSDFIHKRSEMNRIGGE
jgi:hypothetical protein